MCLDHVLSCLADRKDSRQLFGFSLLFWSYLPDLAEHGSDMIDETAFRDLLFRASLLNTAEEVRWSLQIPGPTVAYWELSLVNPAATVQGGCTLIQSLCLRPASVEIVSRGWSLNVSRKWLDSGDDRLGYCYFGFARHEQMQVSRFFGGEAMPNAGRVIRHESSDSSTTS